MDLLTLIRECAAITKSKKFDTSQHLTQTMLIATEVAEATELLTHPSQPMLGFSKIHLESWAASLEASRRDYADREEKIKDCSKITDLDAYLEEYADILIRVASYIGGNGWEERFVEALAAKMDKNRGRPVLHGKGF